jgi:hypothetical protein
MGSAMKTDTMKNLIGNDKTIKVAISAITSGTTSIISGGKFVNGAVSGAFVQMFNDNQHYSDKVSPNSPRERDMLHPDNNQGNMTGKWNSYQDANGRVMYVPQTNKPLKDTAVKMFKGLSNSYRKLMEYDTSKLSPEGEVMLNFFKVKITGNISKNRGMSKIDDYNTIEDEINTIKEYYNENKEQ